MFKKYKGLKIIALIIIAILGFGRLENYNKEKMSNKVEHCLKNTDTIMKLGSSGDNVIQDLKFADYIIRDKKKILIKDICEEN